MEDIAGATAMAGTLVHMFDTVRDVGSVRAVEPMRLETIEDAVIPEAGEAVYAGFPSPAQDYWSGDIDLGEHLIRDRTSTFIVRAVGSSMERAGIYYGDRLIVDRSITPQNGHIVIAILDGELTVKRLRSDRGMVSLCAENPAFPVITIAELSDLTIWGVVTWVLHRASRV